MRDFFFRKYSLLYFVILDVLLYLSGIAELTFVCRVLGDVDSGYVFDGE